MGFPNVIGKVHLTLLLNMMDLQVISNFAKDYRNYIYATLYKSLGVLYGNRSIRILKLKWDIFCKIYMLLLYKLCALLSFLGLQLLQLYAYLPSLELQLLVL